MTASVLEIAGVRDPRPCIETPPRRHPFHRLEPVAPPRDCSIRTHLPVQSAVAVWARRLADRVVRIPSRLVLPVNRRDPRAKTWVLDFVCELDALPVPLLREKVKSCITEHIDVEEWKRLQEAEDLEKQTLDSMRSFFVQEQHNS